MYLLFFESTIKGNTADLAVVQKTNIDTLHKESKSQRVITERGGCSRSAVSKHIKCKVDWKKEIGKKNVHTHESQSLEEEWRDTEYMFLKSSVKFPQSVMIWAAMSSAGVGPLCFLKSTINAVIYQEMFEHFMLSSANKLYGDADFIFQQDLAPAHTAKGTKSWFNDHGFTVLDWPADSPDLNPIENLRGIVKRKMRDTRLNNADELKAAIRSTWASLHLSRDTD